MGSARKPAITTIDLEHDLLQLLVSEAVRPGLETPLRDPILEAVAETTGDPPEARRDDTEPTAEEGTGSGGKSRLTMVGQGLTVFGAMFAVLYVALSYLLDGESVASSTANDRS